MQAVMADEVERLGRCEPREGHAQHVADARITVTHAGLIAIQYCKLAAGIGARCVGTACW